MSLDRNDDLDVHVGGRTRVDDLDLSPPRRSVDRVPAAEEPGDLLERTLRGREPDSLHRTPDEVLEPLEREREVGASLRSGNRVDFVDDHRIDVSQRLTSRRGEHQVERFGCRDEEVGGISHELSTLVGGGVTGAHPDGRYVHRAVDSFARERDPPKG